MPNRVKLRADGIIEQLYAGDQTDESLAAVVGRTETVIARLRAAGKPVRILVDISALGKLTTATRRLAVQALTRTDYDSIAVFGATVFSKALVNLIAYAAGKSRSVRIFSDRAKAITWLERYGQS